MVTIHPIETIVSDPAIHDGELRIAGSRVRVVNIIASHLYRGLTADELAVNFNLNLGQVYAALAYYYQHKPELDARLRAIANETEELVQRLSAQGKIISLE